MNPSSNASPVRTAIDIAINLLLVFAVLFYCFQIVSPFISIILWAVIIAVALYPVFLKLQSALGGSSRLAIAVFVLVGLSLILVPAWLFADSLIGGVTQFVHNLESGDVHIPAANENVKSWPLVGPALYESWSAAADNLTEFAQQHSETLRALLGSLVGRAAGVAIAVVQFVFSTLIAAVMLASATSATAAMQRLSDRIAGSNGAEMLKLSTATIRSVAVGVLGIAFIQAFLGGLGMIVMGIPMAGLWALIILVLAIAQLPPLLVLLPAILFAFSTNDNTVANVIFAIWSVFVSFSDGLLKPLLLGRGVNAPMVVILLGAIGGMLYGGLIGLFLGAVILALGYNLFSTWLVGSQAAPEKDPEQAASPE